MKSIQAFPIFLLSLISLLSACKTEVVPEVERPMDPWAFRSVLDKRPRMLTLALDSACYVAYDLSRSTLYKAWKGGVMMEGTVYTDKKNVQPTSWGAAYFSDSLDRTTWEVEMSGKRERPGVIHKGYRFRSGGIELNYALVLSSGDTLQIQERPAFVRDDGGKPGLERVFKTTNVPKGGEIFLRMPDSLLLLTPNGTTRSIAYFDPLPTQSPPKLEDSYDHLGRYWMETSDCFTCHEMENDNVGPSFRNIATQYTNNAETMAELTRKVIEGGAGTWGTAVMNPHPNLAEKDVMRMLAYIFTLKPSDKKQVVNQVVSSVIEEDLPKPKPGFGAPLEGVHPSYDHQILHSPDFQPRVGGLAFLPDGRLLVTTWDEVGGVYLLDGVETGDPGQITVKRIASGLAEPLGIEVVDGEIYVLQKHELTRLIDHDGDEVIDEYQAVSNSWGVTGDFHEFAFGLVHKDGYFYVTLSLAMRLMEGESQHPDRGRTIKIGMDGQYEWLNYGLRTPNGIGFGPEDELFVTDNQGQWLPANKLIHVKKDEFLGMVWGLPAGTEVRPPEAPPAIWLPNDEIGNSPTEPILMQDGPYKGQLLHGDVTNGGIKRDFLEKINGEYQGAVFRFSQGFEAGVNRLAWGPDGALYVGGVGMVGGWSWKEKRFALERMKYNGQSTFEMLALRARPNGFEIEFTEPVEMDGEWDVNDILIQQWWYESTERYGGPKMDLETMKITKLEISDDKRRVYMEIPDLKERHVVYVRLPEQLKGAGDMPLWSSEAWYTLNNIPKQ